MDFFFFFCTIPSSREGVSGEVEMGVKGFEKGFLGFCGELTDGPRCRDFWTVGSLLRLRDGCDCWVE